jgi:hypothetical protein
MNIELQMKNFNTYKILVIKPIVILKIAKINKQNLFAKIPPLLLLLSDTIGF